MDDLSLHILDIVENSLAAKATHVMISLHEQRNKDTLLLLISDDGAGMDDVTAGRSTDPFFTTKSSKRTGLGLPFLSQSAEEAGGTMEVASREGGGTTVIATFQLSHIDRKPLGNVEETIRCLRATHPEVEFSFEYAITDD